LFWGKIELTYAFSSFYFVKEGKLQNLMHQLKYNGNTQIGVFLGREVGKDFLTINPQPPLDLIIPVPLHPDKKRKRGYNQSQFIAQGVSQVIKKELDIRSLKRVSYN